ncbi:8-oxoguanine DNA glycosylase [Candidatus Lokiarchaeum ossiferum]|uniref:8-oxoguanine DNA glycosylase n=1 Tax=Candidatus Lokiarchaeum ossiferum TaxID=2951803 RepID=UPI00352EECDD
MLSVENNIIPEIVSVSANNYPDELRYNFDFCKRKKSGPEMWFELIYTILAGTQVQTKIAKKSYDFLFNNYIDLLHPNFLKNQSDFDYISNLVKNSLKKCGYRFYLTKTKTIYNTILYFSRYNFDINYFLQPFQSYNQIRNELANSIKGIGIKIVSHWLRNIGYPIPIIDIHIKNILSRFRIIDLETRISYKQYEKVQNDLIKSLGMDPVYFDLALWLYGKNMCGKRKCNKCKFLHKCDNKK